MNNAAIADQVAEAHGLTKSDARKLVDAIFRAMIDAAADDNEVSITGFGKFKIKQRPAHEGYNPATGRAIEIAPSKKLGFSAAKALKDKLNG